MWKRKCVFKSSLRRYQLRILATLSIFSFHFRSGQRHRSSNSRRLMAYYGSGNSGGIVYRSKWWISERLWKPQNLAMPFERSWHLLNTMMRRSWESIFRNLRKTRRITVQTDWCTLIRLYFVPRVRRSSHSPGVLSQIASFCGIRDSNFHTSTRTMAIIDIDAGAGSLQHFPCNIIPSEDFQAASGRNFDFLRTVRRSLV